MKVFVIGAVRGASSEWKTKLEDHVAALEDDGHRVHLPHRDTRQDAAGIDICRENADAIKAADEVHLFYTAESKGSHFDMGVAFALDKKLVVVSNVEFGPGKSYPRMAEEWADETVA